MLYFEMIRNITILIIMVSAIFFMFYYSKSTSLTLTSKGVEIKLNNKTIFLESIRNKVMPLTFNRLSVMQNSLSDGTYFEVASCEDGYHFEKNMQELIGKIFDANRVEQLFFKGDVYGMRVHLKNGQVINLVTQINDSTTLKIFYGIPYENFSNILKKLTGKEFKTLPLGGLFELPTTMTKWNKLSDKFQGVIVSPRKRSSK